MVKKKVITYEENWHVICDECNQEHLAFPMELDMEKEVRSCGWYVENGKHVCFKCHFKQKTDFELFCDCCKKRYQFVAFKMKRTFFKGFKSGFQDFILIDAAANRGWLIDGDKYYCPDCWYLDGEEPVVREPEPRNLVAVRLNEGMEL